MLNKILKSLLDKKPHGKYSSSDFKRRKYSNRHHHPSKYGHQYYKRKGKSSSFFSSYSS